MSFADSHALGGHVSKLHPGKSDAYNYKLMRREERTGQRNALALAKQLVAESSGPEMVKARDSLVKKIRDVIVKMTWLNLAEVTLDK